MFFLTGPPLKISLDWPPPNLLGVAPPLNFLSVGIIFTLPDTLMLDVFDHEEGPDISKQWGARGGPFKNFLLNFIG